MPLLPQRRQEQEHPEGDRAHVGEAPPHRAQPDRGEASEGVLPYCAEKQIRTCEGAQPAEEHETDGV
eukprot:CAMPEP_0173260460 /NCGR_PEP_ID=MMETSP1142-20121109/25591_1 /TAXON_ID=483371 /ORGANISM="non described non described, Strain CCMP2298" /LENGTH=66 /DNA_ID=CAMNT_0014195209 /DNA_START=282 /DNA_END=482 /DNA_ORIENTATION=+